MKRYVGGDDGKVLVVGDGESRFLEGVFSWGDQTAPSARLSMQLLNDLLEDPARALLLHRRFLHRFVLSLPKGHAFVATADSMMAVVKNIEDVEREAAPMRAMIGREAAGFKLQPGFGRYGQTDGDMPTFDKPRR